MGPPSSNERLAGPLHGQLARIVSARELPRAILEQIGACALCQQHILDLAPDTPMLAMRMDTALASFRTMVEKAIAELGINPEKWNPVVS